MDTPERSAKQRHVQPARLRTALYAVSAIVIVGLLLLGAHGAWRSYQDAVATAEVTTQNLSRTLEEHAVRTIRAVDQTLLGIITALRVRRGQPPLSDEEVVSILRAQMSGDTEFRNIFIVNAAGEPAYASGRFASQESLAERSYFRIHRDTPNAGLVISEPILSRAGSGWFIALSRRLENADGSFAGVIIASVALEYFENFYASLDVGPNGAVSLWNLDSVLLARIPSYDQGAGRGAPAGFSLRNAANSGTAKVPSPADGITRVISYRRVSGYPLFVAVGLADRDFLAKWRRDTAIDVAATLALALIIAVLTWALGRELYRRERAELQFSALAANIPGAVYRRRRAIDGTITYPWISPAIRELYGWSPADVAADPHILLNAIHPDDRASLDAAFAESAANLLPLNWEGRITSRRGAPLWVQVVSRPQRCDDGAIEWDGVILDRTEARQMAERLAENGRLLTAILDAVPAVINVKGLDRRYLLVNQAAVEAVRMTPDQAIGLRREDLGAGNIHPDEAQRYFEELERIDEEIFATGKARLNYDETITQIDGRQRTRLVSKTPLRDEAGRIYGLLTVATDITDRKRDELAIMQGRELLRHVVDSVPAVINVKGLDLRYILVNKALADELGCAPEYAIGKSRSGFPLAGVTREENAAFFADIEARDRRVLESGAAILFHEERVERTDGSQQTKLSSKVPLRDPKGRIYALLTIAIDISDRKRAEEALEQSRQLLQAIIDAVPATVSVKDMDLRYLLINRALADQLGCEPDDAIGKRLDDFPRPNARSEESAKLAARVAVVERQVLAEGKARLGYEDSIRMADGTLWTGFSSKVPLRDAAGKPYALLTVVIDISARKQAEQALQQSRQLLQDVIDAVPAAIAVKDSDLRFILVNRAFEDLYELPAAKILGRRTGEFRGSENAAHVEAMDRHVLQTGAAVPFRELDAQADVDRGRTYWMGKMPLRNAEGRLFGTVGVALDITERKATEEKLRQSQKLEAIGQLTGGLAHDFNNLLSIILGNLELLNERLEGQEPLRALAQTATRATLRGADLTQRLLAYARRQPLQPRLTDINHLIGDVVEILTRTLGETIQLVTKLDPRLWTTQIDPGQLESALINLAVNARDAMPKGGALTIETMNTELDEQRGDRPDDVGAGSYVLVAVSDTGHGMPPEVVERAFEPFFSTKDTGKGSGLGLSMVYGFVRQSGGYVKIYSEVGRGTTVKLYLPRAAGADAPVQVQRTNDGVPTGNGERVLIVEDNAAVQALVVLMVQTLGYSAVAAADAPSALGLMSDCLFDLLLTDVILPRGMGGPALAREARVRCPGLKVIYMSGYTESTLLRDNAVEPDAILISKPFRKAELARRLREALGTRQQPAR